MRKQFLSFLFPIAKTMDIQISSLSKTYQKGARPALDNLSLRISTGTFGLLGPNGGRQDNADQNPVDSDGANSG